MSPFNGIYLLEGVALFHSGGSVSLVIGCIPVAEYRLCGPEGGTVPPRGALRGLVEMAVEAEAAAGIASVLVYR
jgi:hypothetical protein